MTNPVFDGLDASLIASQGQQRLQALRLALEAVHEYRAWLDAYSTDDLSAPQNAGGPGLSSAGATMLKNAFADADGLYNIANQGTPVESLPYNFLTSWRAVIGPLF
jgi:hypothetical protein